MRRFYILSVVLVFVVALSASHATAQLITFEQTPAGGTPIDDALLSTPYNLTGGGTVRFYFDDNGNTNFDAGTDDDPMFEAIGADGADGFTNSGLGASDVAAPGFASQLGSFFVRPQVTVGIPDPFVVDYATGQTITALSGEIWDIDGTVIGTELWLVSVLDSSNLLLASQVSPLGNTTALDGRPWVFSFTGLPLGVDKVRLDFIGTKTNNIGLAFNNFSPTVAVPEPGSLGLLGVGCGLMLGVVSSHRRRRRHANQTAQQM